MGIFAHTCVIQSWLSQGVRLTIPHAATIWQKLYKGTTWRQPAKPALHYGWREGRIVEPDTRTLETDS